MNAESIASLAPIDSFSAVSEPSIHRFSVDQYHEMISAGILTENDRVQLIDGYIVAMNPIGPPHSYAVQKLTKLLASLLSSDWEIRVQQPVTLSASEPEPDVVVARGQTDDFKTRHPGPAEAALVIEVADSSVAFDRGAKAAMYAHDGVSEYWIVNLTERTVEVYQSPTSRKGETRAAYATRTVVNAMGMLHVVLDGRQYGAVRVADILP